MFDGDPDAPGFLDIRWVAAGTDHGLPDADVVAAAGPEEGFDGQHNATVRGDRLWLFDNRGPDGSSRAARYRLDGAEVRLDEAWSMGTWCQIQGGAVPVDGGVLATCATTREVREFRDGQPEPAFALTAGCGLGGIGPGGEAINRAIPIWW